MNLKAFINPSNRSLIREMVVSDFKLRYQNSVLGYLWSLLRPLLMFGVLYVVFTRIVKVGNDVPHYPSYLLLGLVLWTFFVESSMAGMNSIVGRGDMIRKVSVPKYVIVISTTMSALVNFILNMVVVFVFMILGDVPFRANILLVPLLVGELVLFALGVSFLLSALFVKFRDISHLWDVILQVLFYATPIIYSLARVPERLSKLVSLNPLTQIIQDIRSLMITPATVTTKQAFGSQLGRLLPLLLVIIVVVIGVKYFKNSSPKFAEEL